MCIRKIPLYAAIAVVAIAIGLGIGYFTRRPAPGASPQTDVLLLHPPKALPEFTLVTDSQATFTRASLRGHWSLLYFGYTHCPDVCPTTLAALSKVSGLLKTTAANDQPQVYFVSVDPKRDTAAVLSSYLRNFDSAFVGVTGPVNQLRLLTKPLGVGFAYLPADQTGNYSVDHSAVIFLINPEAEEAAIFSPPIRPPHTASEYRSIVSHHESYP